MPRNLLFNQHIRGLHRVRDPWLGEGVEVDACAGDAAPFLTREIYESLGGQPAFESLPDGGEIEMHYHPQYLEFLKSEL